MPPGGSTDSPLEAAAGAAGPQAIEALKQLGNETRLAILLALWEAYEPFAEDSVVSFSALRRRVGMRDKGQFYYHLDKLVGRFVRRTEDGYELRNAGRKIVRAVIAGTGLQEVTVHPTVIDKPCPYCEATTAITYENEWLFQVCTECEGTFAESDEFLPGTLTVWPISQAGLSERTPEEMFVAGAVATIQQYALMFAGVCPECSGPVDTWLDVCREHDPSGDAVCPTCGRRYRVQARFVCTVCKNKMWGPTSILIAIHPTVVGFYADRGIDLGYDSLDLAGVTQLMALVREHERAVVLSENPLRARITLQYDTDELQLTLDDTLTVRDIDRSE